MVRSPLHLIIKSTLIAPGFSTFRVAIKEMDFPNKSKSNTSQLLCGGRRSEMGKVWLFERTKITAMFIVQMNDQTWIIFRIETKRKINLKANRMKYCH